MNGIADYFAMGGYGGYIWPAYGIVALVLVGLLVASLAGLRNSETLLRRLQQDEDPRRRRRKPRTEEASPEQDTTHEAKA